MTHYSATGAVMLSVDYTYDEDSLVTGCTRTLGDRVTEIAYGYDGQQRLAREIWTEDSTQVYGVEYTYDDVGNRYTWGVYDPVSEATVVRSATYAYTASAGIQAASASNLMVGYEIANATAWTYTWDKNGNLKGAVAEVGGTDRERRLYGWDSDNRLVEVEVQGSANGTTWSTTRTVAFVYCPSCGGKRTQKLVWDGERDSTPDEWYRYEGEGLNELRVDERYDSQSDGNAVIDSDDPWRTLRYTVHGPGQISHEIKEVQFEYFGASPEPTSTHTIYYHFDRLGNVLGISDDDGALLQSYSCDAFGVDLDGWDDTYTTRRITGKRYDPDTGFHCFQARWYDPRLGRFVSPDPAEVGLDFVLVGAVPTVFVDPSGLNKVLCAYSNVRTAGGAHMTAGHAFVALWDTSAGKVTTYGLWPDDHPDTVDNGPGSDIRVNFAGDGPQGYPYAHCLCIDADQEKELKALVKQNVTWEYTYNCAAFARKTFRKVTGVDIDADDYWGIDTPRELGENIVVLNGGSNSNFGSPGQAGGNGGTSK